MADIRPFQAIRPARGLEARVAALPYDVYSRKEAYIQAAKDRLSFLNIDRPETQFAEDTDMYAERVYKKAGDMIRERLEQGVFVSDEKPMYYLYELTQGQHVQTGVVACAAIDDYLNHVIREHENTREEKEADRIRHIDACGMQTGPVFLAYHRNEAVQEVVQRIRRQDAVFDFGSFDGVRHRGWCVSRQKDIETLQAAFGDVDRLYIADGHHRAASAVRVGQRRRRAHPDYDGTEAFNFFLAVLFPEDELTIMDYNRAVRDLNGMTQEEFLGRIAQRFEARRCVKAKKPEKKGVFAMYLGDTWYELRLRAQHCREGVIDNLDVSVLQRELLAPVLGIADPKNDARLDFIGGVRGLEELERRVHTDCAVAFAMYPTAREELFAVADAGLLMPPKSTWFEPKLYSGLFLHQIER
ncbi:MAG: DUF1015 domain-containing protein [Lachnospiraceae bacterium]